MRRGWRGEEEERRKIKEVSRTELSFGIVYRDGQEEKMRRGVWEGGICGRGGEMDGWIDGTG